VRLAFLELMQPDLWAATTELAASGVDAIRIVPIFLRQGGHLRRDLPEQLRALRAQFPQSTSLARRRPAKMPPSSTRFARFCVRGLKNG